MLLSKACVYGLRASLYLASQQDSEYISIGEMSDKLHISFHFLTKVLQELTAAGLMESQKGPQGGIRLTKAGKKVNLYEIVVAIDGEDIFSECALGLPGCGTSKPCPLHDQWGQTRDNFKGMLVETDIVELSRKGKELKLRITDEGNFQWD